MRKFNALDWVSMILVIIGGLNWGLYGLFDNLDLVKTILGVGFLSDIVYVLVGLSALYLLISIGSLCRRGGKMAKPEMGASM